jgi:serine/threonine protein kinase
VTTPWPAAPYLVGGAVWDADRFAGRESLLTSLCALAREAERPGFILSGPRRSGKSSVLERLARILGSESFVARIDLLGILGYTDEWPPRTVAPTVLQSLLDVLEAEFGTVPSVCRDLAAADGFDVTAFRRRALPAMLSLLAGQRLTVFFDEMEVAQARDPVAPRDIAAALTPWPGARDVWPFIGMVWGRAFGRGLTQDVPSQFKDFHREELKRLERIEVEQALTRPLRGAYEWNVTGLARAWELTSGHPLFVAALGSAVHNRRVPGERNSVDRREVDSAIESAIDHGQSWGDAWRQLNSRQQIALRALTDLGTGDLAQIVTTVRRWGAPYERSDFEPFMRSLTEDGLIRFSEEGASFPVEMIRHWILRKDPADILGTPEDPRDGLSAEAARRENAGRAFYEQGNLDEAARSFQAALELDATRWSAAVWLGQILLRRGQAVIAADLLRGATPTAEVRRIRAQVLAKCLEDSIETHGDSMPWITELRTVDPHQQDAPDAVRLIARVYVDTWWQELQVTDPSRAVEITDRHVLQNGEIAMELALKRARLEIEGALDGGMSRPALEQVALNALPFLLRESEPSTQPETVSQNEQSSQNQGVTTEWERCYVAELSLLSGLGTQSLAPADGIPAAAFQRLLKCRASSTRLGLPLRRLLAATLNPERLVELSLSNADSARSVARLAEYLEPSEAVSLLHRVFGDASLAASSADPGQVSSAVNSLADVGLTLTRIARGIDNYAATVHLQDLAMAAGFLVDRLESDPACASISISPAVVEEWQALFGALRTAAPDDVRHLESALGAIQDKAGPRGGNWEAVAPSDKAPSRRIDSSSLQEILGTNYSVEHSVPYRIHGVPPGYVWAWSVERLGKRLLARAYRVDGGEPSVQAFLAHLWENERRLLSSLGTRWEGRALPRLRVSRFDPRRGILVLVTDFVGPQTLRDLLSNGEIALLRRKSRASLWGHLQGILDALAALHRAGYIHRAVRPDNILIDSDGRSNLGRQWLRLANFEWSVYLYGIANSQAPEARLYDRYISPERLAVHRTAGANPQAIGEGTISDAFMMGLVLFECLVEPFHSEELLPVGPAYSIEDHLEWISHLLERVDHAFRQGDLWSDEVGLLKDLLMPDPNRRRGDIDLILERVARLAQQETPSAAISLSAPLHLVTTLHIGTNESIARYIKEELPTADFSDLESLRCWIQEELQGASVRPNRRAGAPLLLEGRSLNFTVEPFTLHGAIHRHVGWLKVAKQYDGPTGSSLGRLSEGIEVHNYRKDMRLAPLLTAPNGWGPWFAAVEKLQEGLTANERAFVDRIRWTVELERSSWSRSVLPYKLIDYVPGKRPGEPDLAIIQDPDDSYNDRPDRKSKRYELADLMAQSVDRENTWFELGPLRDPTAIFLPERRWMEVDSDADKGLIKLNRYRRDGGEPPPKKGWIRPYSLAGHRTLYRRRKDVLTDLERDPFLVKSVLTPEDTFDDLNLPQTRIFDTHLDADKMALCAAIQNRLPLFVVQGPPGTGKTTLASEVILRTLSEQPSSRILVVSQAHDPLNNLLERVEKALDNWPMKTGTGRRPSAVRLTSEERLDERRYGAEGTKVPRQFHPSRVAAGIMEKASAWHPGLDDIGGKALDAWRRLVQSQALHGLSRSLERRLVASANIVYATANDRRLAGLREGSFDLVIYEEAAKALPIEIMGPLRLARRWLLIGDQAQLPPFGLGDLDAALEDDITRLRQVRKRDRPTGADTQGVDPFHILGDSVPPPDIWAGITQQMSALLRFFGYLHHRAARVPLTAPTDAIGGTRPGAIAGLSGMLTTQWRMHPVIGDFVSECFYKGLVHNGEPRQLAKWRRHALASPPEVKDNQIVWLDIPWVGDLDLATERRGFGGGWENGFEARVIIGFLRQLLTGAKGGLNLAIMSPYRAQVSVLKRLIKEYQFPASGVLTSSLHTADSFQGKQADVVMVSLVRNNLPVRGGAVDQIRHGLGFLDSPERSTVIFSRAEKLLVVAGCLKQFRRFPGTTMAKVAEEVTVRASRAGSGVVLLPGQDFLDQKHWDALRRFHERYEDRQQHQRRSQEQRLESGTNE